MHRARCSAPVIGREGCFGWSGGLERLRGRDLQAQGDVGGGPGHLCTEAGEPDPRPRAAGPLTWHHNQIALIACIIRASAGSYVVVDTWRQPVGSAGGDDILSGAAVGLMAGQAAQTAAPTPRRQLANPVDPPAATATSARRPPAVTC